MIEIYLWFFLLFLTLFLIKVACSGTYFNDSCRLDGKCVIVTGANSGIGYETALESAKRGASVILACRNVKRGLEAERNIRHLSNSNLVKFMKLDLASFKSIREFVENVKSQEQCIYSVINNAGVFWCPFQTTKDGFELNFGVNFLGHFLLTILLLPLLEKSTSDSKIINVVSIMHAFGYVNLHDLQYTKHQYNFINAYSDSKLYNVLFTRELSRSLQNKNINVYSADPGIVSTEIGRDSLIMGSFIFRVLLRPIVWLFFKTACSGSQTILYCLCSAGVKSGKYYAECNERDVWESALNDRDAKMLWDFSVKLTGLTDPEMSYTK